MGNHGLWPSLKPAFSEPSLQRNGILLGNVSNIRILAINYEIAERIFTIGMVFGLDHVKLHDIELDQCCRLADQHYLSKKLSHRSFRFLRPDMLSKCLVMFSIKCCINRFVFHPIGSQFAFDHDCPAENLQLFLC